jgi:hypothetical protein
MDGGHGILASDGEYCRRIAQSLMTIYSCIAPGRFFFG